MPSSIEIQNVLLSAAYKNAVAVNTDYVLTQAGSLPKNEASINYIRLNITALQYQFVFGNYYTNTTQVLYDRLNGFIGFDTTINSLDPNAQIPSVIIEIINPAGYTAPIPEIPWSDFDAATEVDGGRYIYYNSNWAGLNPVLSLISPGETALTLGVDYTLISEGGISLLPGGNLPFVYDGQFLRAVSYVLA